MVAVTSPNGSKSASKADWSPLRGRRVVIWPDADSAGLAYANEVNKHAVAAGALSVGIVSPPLGVKVGWDAADAKAEGWTEAQVRELVADAAAGPNGGGATEPGRRHRTPQRDVLIGLTDSCEFWHDAGRGAFVTFPVNSHREHWPVRSREFRMWLAGKFYEGTGSAIGGQALEDGLRILEARAVHDGREYTTFVRVGEDRGKLYLDLCDDRWRVVEISKERWQIRADAPLKLMRSPSMRPLPEPEGGGMLEELIRFVNLSKSISC
jgi:putative DNA primase/helicase